MKPIFKTTALAAFVALSLTACGSSSGSNDSNSVVSQVEVQKAKTSEQAKRIAENLKDSANKAKSAVEQAKSAAEKAKAVADKSQSEVDALKKSISSTTDATKKAALEKSLKAKENALESAKKALSDAQQKVEKAQKSLNAHNDAVKKANNQIVELQKAEAKAAADAKAKAELEAKKKAEEQKRLEAEAKKKAEEAKNAKDKAEKERLEKEAKEKAEAAKRAEEEKKRLEEEAKKKQNKPIVPPTVPTPTTQTDFNSTKTVNGKEWRYIDMGSSHQNWGKNGELIYMPNSNNHKLNLIGAGVVNFNKLSGNKLGKFSGKATDQKYVVASEAATKGMSYIFVNQPYSTYGILSTPTKEKPNELEYQLVAFTRIQDGQSQVKGNATYKGEVIAHLRAYEVEPTFLFEDSYYLSKRADFVKDDGTVLINVKMDNKTQKLMMDGVINSKSVGEIKLSRQEVIDAYTPGPKTRREAFGDVIHSRGKGKYEAVFGGKDYSDVAGLVRLENGPTIGNFGKNEHPGVGEIKENGKSYVIQHYDATFGATKK